MRPWLYDGAPPGLSDLHHDIRSSFKTWEGEAPAEPELRKQLVFAAQRELRPPENMKIKVMKLLATHVAGREKEPIGRMLLKKSPSHSCNPVRGQRQSSFLSALN